MTIQPPFLGRNLGKGTDVEAWSSFSVWHVIVFPVKLLPPACILVSHQLCVSWLCFIVSLCCTIMFNCVTWTCVFFGFLPFQTPNCDTMKVAIVFVLLFATVLCRPVSRSFLSSQNLKITFAQLRIAFHFWLYFPPILKVVLVYVLRFFDSTCKYPCLLCRQERLLTVLRALRKWWVSWEREREQEWLREREREHHIDWCWLCSQVRKPAPPALKKQAAVVPQAPAAPVQVQYPLNSSIYSVLGYQTGKVGNHPKALETQGTPRVVCPTKSYVHFMFHKGYNSSCKKSFIKSGNSVSSTPTLSRVGMMWSYWSKWHSFPVPPLCVLPDGLNCFEFCEV